MFCTVAVTKRKPCLFDGAVMTVLDKYRFVENPSSGESPRQWIDKIQLALRTQQSQATITRKNTHKMPHVLALYMCNTQVRTVGRLLP